MISHLSVSQDVLFKTKWQVLPEKKKTSIFYLPLQYVHSLYLPEAPR